MGTRKENKNLVDVCDSTIEVTTPYWATNSKGKVRAIVNNKQFEQAVHQEICGSSETPRCHRECRCEQKYKWHRLLAYDPNNSAAGESSWTGSSSHRAAPADARGTR